MLPMPTRQPQSCVVYCLSHSRQYSLWLFPSFRSSIPLMSPKSSPLQPSIILIEPETYASQSFPDQDQFLYRTLITYASPMNHAQSFVPCSSPDLAQKTPLRTAFL